MKEIKKAENQVGIRIMLVATGDPPPLQTK